MYSLRKALQISLLVVFIFCFFTLTAQAKYGGGSRTAEDPYLIKTAEQMNAIGVNLADWDKYFKLIEDIDLSNFTGTTFNIISQWVEWGSLNNQPFAGVFDGNGKTISNFSYNSTNEDGIGIFAYVKGRIQNLQLVNPKIVGDGWNVGSLAGYFEEGRVVNCYVRNADISGGVYVGGLVGTSDGLISSCSTNGRVFGDLFVGGLMGLLGDSLVTNCYSTAAVAGNQNVGGLVGTTDNEYSTINDSYAIGAVSGNIYVGGLTGLLSRGATAKCYSAGKVSGVQYAGGLIGYIRVLATVWNCFWDVEASGQPTIGWKASHNNCV